MTQKEAFLKMAKYCAYQERCQFEVRNKLFNQQLSEEEIENIICELIDQNYLDEERFSRTYVRGKFGIKGWGKVKITQHLKQKRVSEYCIRKGLEEINQDDYYSKLNTIAERKSKELSGEDEFTMKQKVARYLISRGYESEMVWEELS